MDGSATNRYELLFMDDDASDPLDTIIRKKAKQNKQKNLTQTANNTNTTNQNQLSGTNNKKSTTIIGAGKNTNNKTSLASGKENKSSALNKNDRKTGEKNIVFNNNSPTGQKQKINVNSAVNSYNISNNGGLSGQKEQSNFRNNPERQMREGKSFDRGVNSKTNGETREQRNNRRNRDDRPELMAQQQNNQPKLTDYQNDRPVRRGGPQRRNNDVNTRLPKRELARQSGSDKTGVKAVDKREGAGAHNWGSYKQDIEDMNKTTEEEKDDSAGEQQAEQSPVEEETKEITLDEWKAQRAVRAKPQFNIRKAGEGEDLSQWKKMVALNNKKKDGESEEELEYDPSMYPQRVGRLQRVLDIEFHFNDGRRSGGAGRGRGRPRGQGPNGPGRQNRGPRNTDNLRMEMGDRHRGQNAPKVDDEHDFPSLG